MRKIYITPATEVITIEVNPLMAGSLGNGDAPKGNTQEAIEKKDGEADAKGFSFEPWDDIFEEE